MKVSIVSDLIQLRYWFSFRKIHSNYKSTNIVDEFLSNTNCFINIMNVISFYITSQEFSNPLTVLAINTNTPNGQRPRLQTVPYYLFIYFYKIFVLFQSSLSLSTIKYQLFALGVKFGFLYLCKTKVGHSLLWVVQWQSGRLSWEIGWLPCWWPWHRSSCSELMCCLSGQLLWLRNPRKPQRELGSWEVVLFWCLHELSTATDLRRWAFLPPQTLKSK